MIFNEELISEIVESPIEGILTICDKTFKTLENNGDYTGQDHEILLEACALTQSVIDNQAITINVSFPTITENINENCRNIGTYLRHIREIFQNQAFELKVSNLTKLVSLKNRYDDVLVMTCRYEFSQGDFTRIQILISELRELVSASQLIEADHKYRLLARLEKLQSELYKSVSDLDRFWGLVGDAGVALGKFGVDAKPIFDRIKEITHIVWRTQARAEKLPGDTPLPILENDQDDDQMR